MTFDETTNTSSLDSMRRLDRFVVPVGHNETIIQPYSFSPDRVSDNRLELLLFDETVPDDRVEGQERINEKARLGPEAAGWNDRAPR